MAKDGPDIPFGLTDRSPHGVVVAIPTLWLVVSILRTTFWEESWNWKVVVELLCGMKTASGVEPLKAKVVVPIELTLEVHSLEPSY